LNAAVLITGVVLIGAGTCSGAGSRRPTVADLLIDTETELRKVTWPTVPEAVNSSIVVDRVRDLPDGVPGGSDWLLGRWTTLILTGGR
jgi:hypothetical protein